MMIKVTATATNNTKNTAIATRITVVLTFSSTS